MPTTRSLHSSFVPSLYTSYFVLSYVLLHSTLLNKPLAMCLTILSVEFGRPISRLLLSFTSTITVVLILPTSSHQLQFCILIHFIFMSVQSFLPIFFACPHHLCLPNICPSMLGGSLVTMAWHILRLWMQGMTSRYEAEDSQQEPILQLGSWAWG